jgi:4-hydroxybenzoate polyprenyltransferase
VRSTAILFGESDRHVIGVIQVLLLLALWLVGQQAGLGSWYLGGLVLAAVLAAWQQYLIRARSPENCFRAFLNNNYFGMAVFVGIVLDYTFAPA